MKSQLNLNLHKKHLFADTAEGHALIDTGAPFTASRTGKLTWGGSTRMVREGGYLGFNFDTLSANIGTQVDALVGLDLLSEQSMHFDLVTGSLELGVATPAEGSFDIDTSGLMGLPAVNISVNGLMAKAIFDTGAQYGYVLDARFGADSFRSEPFKDFHPTLGDLEPTDAWSLPFSLGDEKVEEIFGLAPLILKRSVGSLGYDVIIGPSWMPGRSTWLDLKGRRMKVGAKQ